MGWNCSFHRCERFLEPQFQPEIAMVVDPVSTISYVRILISTIGFHKHGHFWLELFFFWFIFCKQISPDIKKRRIESNGFNLLFYLYSHIMYSIWYSAVYYLMI